ncbi:hypothetical protein V6N11_065708 [Hibiscus sabdariffa]|uniref:Uncharacterized protein n=1 Tax=Hibiscus sabdariffa TaxID=183260 RepID=A0ABR2PI43_9ROSI
MSSKNQVLAVRYRASEVHVDEEIGRIAARYCSLCSVLLSLVLIPNLPEELLTYLLQPVSHSWQPGQCDQSRKRIITTPKEAKGSHNEFHITAKGKTGGKRTDNHEQQDQAIHTSIDGGRDIRWKSSGVRSTFPVVIYASKQFDDQRNAKQVICIGEESMPAMLIAVK